MITYYNQSLSAIENATEDHKITLNQIKLHTQEVLQKTINSKVTCFLSRVVVMCKDKQKKWFVLFFLF